MSESSITESTEETAGADQSSPAVELSSFLLPYLADRDVACPSCGYNLRNAQRPRCSECGRAIELKISSLDVYLKAWAVLVAVSGANAGIGCLFSIFLFLLVILKSRGLTNLLDNFDLDIPIIYFIASIPATVCFIFFRKRMTSLKRSSQWTISIIHVLVAVAMWLILVMTINDL